MHGSRAFPGAFPLHLLCRKSTLCLPEIHIFFAGNPHFVWSDFAWPGKDAVLGLTRLAPWAGQAWPGVRWPGWCWASPSRDGPQSNPLEPISAGSSTALSRPTSPRPGLPSPMGQPGQAQNKPLARPASLAYRVSLELWAGLRGCGGNGIHNKKM